jgi:hypothetical protein
VTFGLLPFAAGFVAIGHGVKLAIVGGIVFADVFLFVRWWLA